MQVRARQGDTVDGICQRVYGRTAGVTEAALEANRGLADLGPVLPAGVVLDLPDPAHAVHATVPQVQLWS